MTADDVRRGLARLRAAVEQMADALAAPRVEALLACELAIEDALTSLPPAESVPPEMRSALRAEIDATRAAMRRCRRLGAGLSDFIRLSFDAQGLGGPYGRQASPPAGRALDARI